jgi:hypothetical protein
MLDEIRRNCALLFSSDFADHSTAYRYLRRCGPFQHVVQRFREHDMNLFDVANLLAPDGNRPLSAAAVAMLEEELAKESSDRQ